MFAGAAVVEYGHEMVPEEVDLAADDGREVVVEPEHWAGSDYGCVGEGLAYDGLALPLGREVQGLRASLGTGCREVDESVNAEFGAGFGDAFGYLNVDELEVFSLFEFVSWSKKIDGYVGVDEHALHLCLVAVVHAVIEPGAVCLGRKVRVGPQTRSSLSWSECLKLWSRERGMMRLLPARPSSAAMGRPRVPVLGRGT